MDGLRYTIGTVLIRNGYINISKKSHLASNMHSHGVWELECMEEGVGDDGGPRIGAPHLHVL